MSFADIFKSSFLHDFSQYNSMMSTAMYLAMSALMGLYVFLLYKIVTKKSFYNKNFNISLWVLTVVTSAVIITISSNIVLSLGMVGALSIVRYRTAIKDPMDLVFLFWSITEGIVCGAGMANIGFMLAVILTIGLFLLNNLPMVQPWQILTVSAQSHDVRDEIITVVKKHCKHYKLKSQSMSLGKLDLVLEFTSKDEHEMLTELLALPSVTNLAVLQHNGDVNY